MSNRKPRRRRRRDGAPFSRMLAPTHRHGAWSDDCRRARSATSLRIRTWPSSFPPVCLRFDRSGSELPATTAGETLVNEKLKRVRRTTAAQYQSGICGPEGRPLRNTRVHRIKNGGSEGRPLCRCRKSNIGGPEGRPCEHKCGQRAFESHTSKHVNVKVETNDPAAKGGRLGHPGMQHSRPQ